MVLTDQIVTVTDSAREKILEILESQDMRGRGALRVGVKGRAAGTFQYTMALEEDPDLGPDDAVQMDTDFKVVIEGGSLDSLRGATIDFVGQLVGGGFRIENPNSPWDDPMAAAVQRLIDEHINPGVASHGGFVELLDVKDDLVYVRLGGGCQGCGMVDVTLRHGIEALIVREIPQIKGVVDTTDHAGGNNPFYQPAKGTQGFAPAKGGGGCPQCGAAKG
jgi:Fe/S biogenesis protein NfuA